MIYITSDTHFFHNNLIKWGIRKKGDDTKILNSWLELQEGDTLIHCGDLLMGKDVGMTRPETVSSILSSYLKGVNKVLIRGNHDKESIQKYLQLGFNFVCERFYIKYNNRSIEFTHSPLEFGMYSDINIHGHHHGKYGFINKNIENNTFRVDMSVENTGMKPLPLDYIISMCR